MKIMYYVHGLVVGGAETMVVNYMLELKARGVDVVLVVNQHTNTFLEQRVKQAGIKIYALNTEMPEKKIPALLWKVKIRFINYKNRFNTIISQEKPDIIHVHSIITRLKGVAFPEDRIIYTFHADVNRALQIYPKASYRVLTQMAQAGLSFFALTGKAQNDIKQIFRTQNVFVLPNFVDIDRVKRDVYDRSTCLKILDIPESAYVVGHIGRFHEVKNHEKIIDIFKSIHEKNDNSFLVLIGGGDRGRILSIQDRVKQYGLEHYVRFTGIREDADALMGCFDAFLLPSFSECFPLVIIEAQALGVRCVLSDRVPQDVVCNKNCSSLPVDAQDSEWADTILSKDIADGTQDDIYQFDKKTVVDKMIGYYEEILSRGC